MFRFFDHMPEEIIVKIVAHISEEDQARLAQVDHKLERAVSEPFHRVEQRYLREMQGITNFSPLFYMSWYNENTGAYSYTPVRLYDDSTGAGEYSYTPVHSMIDSGITNNQPTPF